MLVPVGPIEEQWPADRRLWLTADRERVVEEDDPEAAILYATVGWLVPLSEAEKYGLVPTKKKQQKASADKRRKEPELDKSTAEEE